MKENDSSLSDDSPLIEEAIGYRFRDRDLLMESVTHPSYVQKSAGEVAHNQRLEFLGDAVLSAILAERLFDLFPDMREGELSQRRSVLARGMNLTDIAVQLSLDRYIRLGAGEESSGGRSRDSILEDALEALVGAIFLDSDWETTRSIVLAWFGDLTARVRDRLDEHNPKGDLQEAVQAVHGNNALTYRVLSESGPDHRKAFRVEVLIAGRPMGEGEGSSKKTAEEDAARVAIRRWRETGDGGS